MRVMTHMIQTEPDFSFENDNWAMFCVGGAFEMLSRNPTHEVK
jgi:hypothetical protein